MMRSVLIANRGEIAVRVIRTVHALGIEAIAVYSDADRHARHVAEADRAVRLGPAPALESYLSVPAILRALEVTGAEAVHPGYGFLSENATFARAVVAAGVTWIGPPPDAIDAMGDKIRAKATVAAAGVPVVPGRMEPGLDDEELAAAAIEVGLPVLIKPSAGGGGKGMHRVDDVDRLAGAIASARREARASFGDDTLLVERWVTRPRHIEVQVFADMHGTVVHLGERECSLQRRHQKIIEEAPSPLLDAATRARLGASAVDAARACGYVGAGTVEFIVSADRPDEYFFLEMNTRLQVEHPVTELVTGLDLVEAQLRVAAGEPLPFGAEQATAVGHAVEARVYAEDPARGFLPSSGQVLAYGEPAGAGVRVDSSLTAGTVVGTDYDPMLAKVIAWGVDRDQARRRLVAALADFTVLGVTTNVGFLRDLLEVPEVVSGDLNTELIERELPQLIASPGEVDKEVAMAAGALWALEAEPSAGASSRPVDGLVRHHEPGPIDPWDLPGAWRVGGPVPTTLRMSIAGAPAEITVVGRASGSDLRIGVVDAEGSAVAVPVEVRWLSGGGTAGGREGGGGTAGAREGGGRDATVDRFQLTVGGDTHTWAWAADGDDRWLGRAGRSWVVRPIRSDTGGAAGSAATGGPVTSPMPGTVLAVAVTPGQAVAAGEALVVVEAMKMEHTVVAPVDGIVSEVLVRAGQSVKLDEALAVVSPPRGETEE
jgi:acetyl-CoA/propionyl-CoA carboxylase biotin carboxyl carrier protein